VNFKLALWEVTHLPLSDLNSGIVGASVIFVIEIEVTVPGRYQLLLGVCIPLIYAPRHRDGLNGAGTHLVVALIIKS